MEKFNINSASEFEEAIVGIQKEIEISDERFINDLIQAFTDTVKETLKTQPVRTRTDEEGFYVFLARKFLAFNNDYELRDRFMNTLCEEIGFLIKDKLLEVMDKILKDVLSDVKIPNKINGQKIDHVEAHFRDEIIEDIYHRIECRQKYNAGYLNALNDILVIMNEDVLDNQGLTS